MVYIIFYLQKTLNFSIVQSGNRTECKRELISICLCNLQLQLNGTTHIVGLANDNGPQ